MKELLVDKMQEFNKADRQEYFEKLPDVAALVLCKSELFFQSADGKTLFTLPCVGHEAAIMFAIMLKKEIMIG